MQKRIEKLRSQINKHNHYYHVLNHPEISDQQFDEMFEKLIELEKHYPEFADPNSPTQRVGSDLTHNLTRLPHPSPMRSIQSFYNDKKLLRAMGAADSDPLIITPKYDGIAIELTYQNGELEKALTRGNGNTGGNVTPNARTIKQIPLSLYSSMPHAPCTLLILRGEVFVTEKELTRLNRARKKEKKEPLPNCRAAAATLLKAKRSITTSAANLSIVFFYAECGGECPPSGDEERQRRRGSLSVPDQLAILSRLQLPTPETQTAATPAEALNIAAEIAAKQHPFPTDGAVIKAYNPHNYQPTTRTQPGTWAYKPNNPVWETTCRFVSWKVGKTGKVTPLAHFMPFKHNGTEFHKAVITPQLAKQLQPRQTIHVQITGGIIPKVIKSTTGGVCTPDKGDEIPSGIGGGHCPYCHQPLTNNRCQNTTYCPAFGHTAETVKQHTGWLYEFPVFKDFDGNGIYITATQGHNAILVQQKPRKHDMVLITDTLDTAARVGVRIGELDKGPFNFESNF